jgi:hypothetical protein
MPKRSPIVQKLIDHFKGLDSKKEEMGEARAVKAGKISPKEYAKGEKKEGDAAKNKALMEIARKLKAKKITPDQCALTQADINQQISQDYGVTPASNIANAWDVAGGRIYGQPALTKFLAELADLTKGMTPIQQQLHNVALAAGMVQFKGKPINAKSLVGQLNKALETANIAHVADPSEAAEILNDQISQMVAAGKGARDTTLSKLASLHENITGEESNAYKLAQQPKETKSKKEKAGALKG